MSTRCKRLKELQLEQWLYTTYHINHTKQLWSNKSLKKSPLRNINPPILEVNKKLTSVQNQVYDVSWESYVRDINHSILKGLL